MASTLRKIQIQFDRTLNVLPNGNRLSKGVSAATATTDALWLAHDETVAVERLCAERTKAGSIRYAKHRRFDLRELIRLPARAAGKRTGLASRSRSRRHRHRRRLPLGSGLACAGSRPTRRKIRSRSDRRARRGSPIRQPLPARANSDASRLRTGLSSCVDVERAMAACFAPHGCPADARHDALTRTLRDDPHLGPFLSIPSKDNGFDIEGLAAAPGGRLFLGLRGPVLNGWACVLEIIVASSSRSARRIGAAETGAAFRAGTRVRALSQAFPRPRRARESATSASPGATS